MAEWHAERSSVRAEDEQYEISPTLYAARNGFAAVLEARLILGADPNQDDGYGGTCLIASACYAQLECTRLLIAHGGDVSYAYPGDNASILYMLALCFKGEPENSYQEGDYVATADLLIEAGAPTTLRDANGRTALNVLQTVEAEDGTRKGRELRGLIDLLERRYWRVSRQNPFLRPQITPENAAELLTKGAANNDSGHVDITRVRSIDPKIRGSVVNVLLQYRSMHESFVLILLAARMPNGCELCTLCGQELSIFPLIADFANMPRRRALRNIREAIDLLVEDLGISDGAVGIPLTSREQHEIIARPDLFSFP